MRWNTRGFDGFCVYDDLMNAGEEFGITGAGYYALEGLRIEKGFRAWSCDLHPDINPFEAGLGFVVAMDKPDGFIGRDALIARRKKTVRPKNELYNSF